MLLATGTITGTIAGTGGFAHAIHYGLVAVGVVGIAGILLPHLVQRRSGSTAPRTGHEARVAQLRGLAATGGLTTLASPQDLWVAPRADPGRTLWLPLALVGTTAAAGVHAAIGPAHLAVLPVIGAFFVACALAQAGWSAALLLAPSRWLLLVGVAGHAGLLLLWAASRTTGLPGVLPRREPVGVWDLLAAVFEAGAVAACVVLLRGPHGPSEAHGGSGDVTAALRVAPWLDWHPRAHLAVALSVTALLLASLSGAPA